MPNSGSPANYEFLATQTKVRTVRHASVPYRGRSRRSSLHRVHRRPDVFVLSPAVSANVSPVRNNDGSDVSVSTEDLLASQLRELGISIADGDEHDAPSPFTAACIAGEINDAFQEHTTVDDIIASSGYDAE